jgi:mitogen-activated protein kinase kinase
MSGTYPEKLANSQGLQIVLDMQAPAAPPRPAGPRGMPIDRASSPAPFALPQTAPLNIRKTKAQALSSPQASPPSSSSRPSTSDSRLSVPDAPAISVSAPAIPSPMKPAALSLKIPGATQRPAPPKLVTKFTIPKVEKGPPKLSLNTNNNSNPPLNRLESPTLDVAFSGGYYGGASFEPTTLSAAGPEDATIRPPTAAANTMEDLRATIKRLDISQPPSQPSSITSDINAVMANSDGQWSDEFLQELDRLGEGAGGAVHTVRDKRTDVVMAR